MTFKKILVPLDGSTNSEKVLAWVTGLAEKLKAELVLLAVVTPGALSSGAPGTTPADDPAQVAASYLETQADALRQRGVTVTATVEPGTAAEAIIDTADRLGVDMIAMATHRDHLIERGILGSVTDTVLRTASLPVLAVNPDGSHASSLSPGAPSTVIVPLDGSDLAEESVPIALDIAASCSAEIIFIKSVHLPSFAISGPGAEFYDTDFGVSDERERARKYLAKFVEQAEAAGIPAKAHAALGNAAGRNTGRRRSYEHAAAPRRALCSAERGRRLPWLRRP